MRKGIGCCKVIVIVAVQLLFKKSEESGGCYGHNKIDDHYDACGFEEGIKCAGSAFVHEEKVRKADYGKDGSILDVDDEVVADLGNDVPEGLGDDYVHHGLDMVHADGFCAFGLTRIDGKDSSADSFRHICAGVDGNDHERGKIGIHFIIENHYGAVIDENGLDYHRGAAEKFDISLEDYVRDFYDNLFPEGVLFLDRNGLDNSDAETDYAAGDCSDEGNDECVDCAVNKCGTVSVPDLDDAFDKFCQGDSPFYMFCLS